VFPYLALGAALRTRGHRVTLAAPETYKARAEALWLDFCPLATAVEVGRMLADPDLWHPLRSGPMMARWGGRMIARQYEMLAGLAREPDSVLVANPGVLAARLVQEVHKMPTASLVLQPGILPSCTAPPAMPGGLGIPHWLPGPLRRLYWRVVDAGGDFLVGPHLNPVRARLGLPPVRRLFRWWLSPDLVIGLFPGWYAAPQSDWPPQLRLAGFARFDGTRAGLADDVRAFCAAGPPPLAFTLGTGMAHAAGFFRAAVAACQTLGIRGLLLTRHAGAVPTRLPPSIRHCEFAPFRELLPLCGAIVHHGGVGTVAAAMGAGCPQLILPLAWDQPDNAARISRLGVGASLGAGRRTGGHIARGLTQVMTAEVRSRCRDVAARFDGADGLGVAAAWTEELAR
jgi:UDP:flavonoid glycosyltransferase YjiC (YdhE family)